MVKYTMHKLPITFSLFLTIFTILFGLMLNFELWFKNSIKINKDKNKGINITCNYYLYDENCFIIEWIKIPKWKNVTKYYKQYHHMISNRNLCKKDDIECVKKANLIVTFKIISFSVIINMSGLILTLILTMLRYKSYSDVEYAVSKRGHWIINFSASLLMTGLSFAVLSFLVIFNFIRYKDYVEDKGYFYSDYKGFSDNDMRIEIDSIVSLASLSLLDVGKDVVESYTKYSLGFLFGCILSVLNGLIFVMIIIEFFKYSKYYYIHFNFNNLSSIIQLNESK